MGDAVPRAKPPIKDAADELMELRRADDVRWPPHLGPRAVRTLALALRCLRICDVARADAGGARTAAEAALRAQALDGLAATARRAVVATVDTPAW